MHSRALSIMLGIEAPPDRGKPVDEEAYFSTGATVTLHALHAIEEIAENRGV